MKILYRAKPHCVIKGHNTYSVVDATRACCSAMKEIGLDEGNMRFGAGLRNEPKLCVGFVDYGEHDWYPIDFCPWCGEPIDAEEEKGENK